MQGGAEREEPGGQPLLQRAAAGAAEQTGPPSEGVERRWRCGVPAPWGPALAALALATLALPALLTSWGGKAGAGKVAVGFTADLVGLVGNSTESCHDSLVGEKCYDSIKWVMQAGVYDHPEWYSGAGLDAESRFVEFQQYLHENDAEKSQCPPPCQDPTEAKRYKGVPGHVLDLPVLGPYAERKELVFYMYRATDNFSDYPLANVNTADLAGVLWYLHNEIAVSVGPQRKYNISRIRRFKATLKTTWAYYNRHRRQFGSFVAFDSGHCTVPDCDRIWEHFGAIPGCQFVDLKRKQAAYMAGVKTVVGPCEGYKCQPPVWYSLPGPCPSKHFGKKSSECTEEFPGGLCDKATGDRDCTYSVESAGHIDLDDLTGIEDYRMFFHKNYREYEEETDKGRNCSFWDGKRDEAKCAKRLEKAKGLFDAKYPDMPKCDELQEPPCDTNGYYEGELSNDSPVYDDPLELGWNGQQVEESSSEEEAAPAESSHEEAAPAPSSSPIHRSGTSGTLAAATASPADETTRRASSTAPPGEEEDEDFGEDEAAMSATSGGSAAWPSTTLAAASFPGGGGGSIRGSHVKEEEYSISIYRSSDDDFGASFTAIDGALVVDEIWGGLVGQWNAAHPKAKVARGDLIVGVNGVRESSEALAAEVEKRGELKIMLRPLEPHRSAADGWRSHMPVAACLIAAWLDQLLALSS